MTTQDPNANTTVPAQTTETQATAPAASRISFKQFVKTQEMKGNFDLTFKAPKIFGKTIPLLFVSKTRLIADPNEGSDKRAVATLYTLHITPWLAIGVVNPKSKPEPVNPPTGPVVAAAAGSSPAAE